MSAAVAAAAAAAACYSSSNSSSTSSRTQTHYHHSLLSLSSSLAPLTVHPPVSLNRYESQKRRDWNTFLQYLSHHWPSLALARCSGAHVLEFLKYLDQFGNTKVHVQSCPFFGRAHAPGPCPCPLKQAWGSLDALMGRLRAAFEENGGRPETNPFAALAVRLYVREAKDSQAKARGIAYDKKKNNYNYNSLQQQE